MKNVRGFILLSLFSSELLASPRLKTAPAETVSVSIAQPPQAVYEYTANPENLPKWASGLSKSKLKKSGDGWIAESPMGSVLVKFSEPNSFGILDHDVTLPDGTTVHNPLRVVKNNDGSEIVFTVLRQPKMSDKDFAKDLASVKKDLLKLKENLEMKQ